MRGRILHLIGQMERGGAERQLLYLADALRAREWEQVVITLSPGEAWDKRIIALGIRLIAIPRNRNKLWRLLQIKEVVRRERPALVHSWSNHTNVYARWLTNGPIPRIFSFRNNPIMDGLGRPKTRVPNSSVYMAADCVVSNSSTALECARSAGVRMRRTEIVGNIVMAHGRARPGENAGTPRVVAAGALIPLKGFDVLLKACRALAAQGNEFELLLAGDGPERHNLERLVTELGIAGRAKLLGAVDDVPALFATAHLAVHPSRSESLSNTILEAMSEGLPVVATDVGGTSEIVSDGRTGLLVAPNQPDLLASKLKQLLDSPTLRAQLGEAGLKDVRERFEVGRITDQYESIYQSIIDSELAVEGRVK